MNAGTHIKFKIKLQAIRFLLMFIYCKNDSLEINYSYLKIGSYFSITLYIDLNIDVNFLDSKILMQCVKCLWFCIQLFES